MFGKFVMNVSRKRNEKTLNDSSCIGIRNVKPKQLLLEMLFWKGKGFSKLPGGVQCEKRKDFNPSSILYTIWYNPYRIKNELIRFEVISQDWPVLL